MRPLPIDDLQHIEATTRGLWSEAEGKRFFLTGGSGFFGIWLLESFLHINARMKLGASMTVLTRNPEAVRAKYPHLREGPALDFWTGDIREFAFPPGNYDYVVHAASETNPALYRESPLEMADTIIAGTRRVLEFAVHAKAGKFLLPSSGAVYGSLPPEEDSFREICSSAPDPLDPFSTYGECKRMAEHLCSLYATGHGIRCKVARCFTFVGPNLPLNAQFAIGNFIRDALAGSKIQISGDGSSVRSYLYASDLAVWLWTILFSAPVCRPFNVGSDECVTISALAEIVRKISGSSTPVEHTNSAASSRRYIPCVRRACDELGLKPIVPLTEGIRKTLMWNKQNQPG